MEHAASHHSYLDSIVVFCSAAAIAVPLFHRIGLSAVIGYLVAGILIGPSVLALISDPTTILGVAELGVVLLLFIIGLELKISHLVQLRRDIFGLGLAQMIATGAVFVAVAMMAGMAWNAALAVSFAFSLSATALALQQLEELGDRQTAYGQRTFSVLLFQDLAVVPLLAIVPLLAGVHGAGGDEAGMAGGLLAAAKAAGAVAALVIAGRYLLNPAFQLLASSNAREVMTAAALLVVLGSALLMEEAGLSMAMGAFLAGLLLAESNFRHQLEADIEPFRGILLGLFFMSVGMSLDLKVVLADWRLLVVSALGLMAAKIAIAAGLARLFGSSGRDSIRIGTLLATAGEFAFVLVPLIAAVGLIDGAQGQFFTALAAITMIAGPILSKIASLAFARYDASRPKQADKQPVSFDGPQGSVLVIGFGRFGQVLNQVLLAENADVTVTVIDNDIEQIRAASRFGFRVFYGDGSRLDVLRAAGAAQAKVICICVDDAELTTQIVDLVHGEFPQALTHARAYDRVHAIALMDRDVDFIQRETFESALAFGGATLRALGTPEEEAAAVVADVRRRDIARLVMQREEGLMSGATLLHGSVVKPEPLMTPSQTTRALSDETQAIIRASEP